MEAVFSIKGCKDLSLAESRQYFLQSWYLILGSLDCLVELARVKAILIFPGFATRPCCWSNLSALSPFVWFLSSPSLQFSLWLLSEVSRVGACCTGVWSGLTTKLLEIPICPRPSNTSLCSFRILVMSSSRRPRPTLTSICIDNDNVSRAPSAKNIGVVFDVARHQYL